MDPYSLIEHSDQIECSDTGYITRSILSNKAVKDNEKLQTIEQN